MYKGKKGTAHYCQQQNPFNTPCQALDDGLIVAAVTLCASHPDTAFDVISERC